MYRHTIVRSIPMTESENRVIPFKKAVHPWIFRNLLSEILHVYFMYANLTVVRPGDEMANFTEKANMNDELLLDSQRRAVKLAQRT